MPIDPGSRDDVEFTPPTSEEPEIDPAVLDLDHVFEILAHPRRRYLMCALATDQTWTLRELATKLVAWEEGIDGRTVHDEMRDRMYVSLYHVHVPLLVEHDVVQFAEMTEMISTHENADEIIAVLEGAGGSLDSQQDEHAKQEYSDESVR